MKYNDFFEQIKLRETKPDSKNQAIAKKVLEKYLEEGCKEGFSYEAENSIENLLYTYFAIKGTRNESKLIELLNSYHFNYSMSIHNAIYYLLATEKEYDEKVNPHSWPGVNRISHHDAKYVLDTILGNIEVFKASEIYEKSPSRFIFDKQLMGQCYERTYDFLKENHDYNAVLFYMPNFFYGGHYHAYLEKKNEVLDIASNAYYYQPDSISKIFCGETIAKLSYKQVEHSFKTIHKKVPEIPTKQKLLTLTLYYDRKNHHK